MLLAKLNGKIVIANQSLNRKCKYYCLVCGELVVFKCGRVMLPYFAHRKGSDCASSEGETMEHLLGKKQIFNWADKLGYQPQYEVYFEKIKQRPDILIEVNGCKVAIEFQCSPLSHARLYERNQGYRKLGIKFIWALGGPYRRKMRDDKVAQFTQVINQQLCIVFWNTLTASFEFNRSFNSIELINDQQPYKIALKQSATISKKIMTRAPDIKRIAELCYVQQHDLRLIPIVAHYQKANWPLMSVKRTFFQTDLLLKLEHFELKTIWTKTDWLLLLDSVAKDNWLSFECIGQIKKYQQRYLIEFTNELIAAAIIRTQDELIYLNQYPVWFQSEFEKNEQIKNVP